MLIQLRSKAPDVSHLVGHHASLDHLLLRVERDATVFKPDGTRLLTLRRGAISEAAAAAAYPFLHGLRNQTTRNRGAYGAQGRTMPIRNNGKVSKTNESPPVRSCVVGFMDRYPRIPFCRECALSAAKPEEWGACLPMIQEVASVFEREVPDRYKNQAAAAAQTHPAYVIPDTPFTTLTVNNTVAGGYHTDAGDFKAGFGVMCVFRRGEYTGGDLVVPRYGVGVDLKDRDVILFDVHEVHGNVPIVTASENAERISVVFYFRERMIDCLSPAEELARAKELRGGALVSDDEDDDGTGPEAG